MKITIDINEDERKVLEKRARKNLLTLQEQVQDIVRRSTVRDMGKPAERKIDDQLVAAFSRDARGRKKKKR